jgi:hypothetical protein
MLSYTSPVGNEMGRGPLPFGEFERLLEKELSLADEFELPLTVVVIHRGGGWDEEATWLALDVLRRADLTSLATPCHLASFLPNTGFAGAKAIEGRMKEALPEASLGFASHLPGDGAADMVSRAREDSESF